MRSREARWSGAQIARPPGAVGPVFAPERISAVHAHPWLMVDIAHNGCYVGDLCADVRSMRRPMRLAWGCGDAAVTTTSTRAASSAATTASTATTSQPALPFGDELQRVLDEVLVADDAMGFSLAVMVPDHEPWLGVAGEAEPGVPLNAHMALGVGSVSKNFTAALVLQLVEEGKLSLDDQLQQWLPEYPNIDSTATIRQLLNHTSGTFSAWKHHPDFWTGGVRRWGDGSGPTDELLVGLPGWNRTRPRAPSGSTPTPATCCSGQIIEEATGSSVSAELRDRFFEPLGLTSAFYLDRGDRSGRGRRRLGRHRPLRT